MNYLTKFRVLARFAWVTASLGVTGAQAAESMRNGHMQTEPRVQVWSVAVSTWVSPVEFWERYANLRGGLTWGRGSEYPPYDEVSEQDTFIVELPSGPCLMEFFHSRWRRANDVRRWDPGFNEFGGCPNVFR